jgi:hypothetical protein
MFPKPLDVCSRCGLEHSLELTKGHSQGQSWPSAMYTGRI